VTILKNLNQSFFFEGGKRAVILFHSFTSTPVDNRMLGRALNKLDYTVYGPLFTNHGKSLDQVLELSPSVWFEDGIKEVQKIRDMGYEDIVVAGVSLGGIVATQLILDDSSLLAAGTFCSPMIAGFDTNTPNEYWKRFVEEKKQEDVDENIINSLRPSVTKGVDHVLDYLDQRKIDMTYHLSRLEKPFFIAQGGADQTIDPMQALEFRDKLKNATVTFCWYEKGGHVLMNSSSKKGLVTDFSHFLDQLPWNARQFRSEEIKT